ncbi:MAG TPA: ATP-binding protein, partial [Actinomycetaceae bacterium]|nr:ATP-binding protein [Actinomycetaceae bacterium]
MTGARRRGVAELLDRIRHTTLETWRTDPSRLRQDANLEDDHARYHADRLVIELAQNAADAAGLADRPGRLLLRLTDAGVLTVANTGRGLDEAGLRALTSLRASAKTSGVGRFGVGFAAVRSVADDLDIVSSHDGCTTGARFSLDLTRAALATETSAHPALGGQLARLDDQLPVLRLPFDLPEAAEQTIPDGYDTAVHLRLR